MRDPKVLNNSFEVARISLKENEGKVFLYGESRKEEVLNEEVVGLFIKLRSDESYRLRMTEALMKDLSLMLKGFSVNVKNPYESNLTEDNVPLPFAELLRTLGTTLEHFSNSTSWVEKDLKSYDLQTLINKLSRITSNE